VTDHGGYLHHHISHPTLFALPFFVSKSNRRAGSVVIMINAAITTKPRIVITQSEVLWGIRDSTSPHGIATFTVFRLGFPGISVDARVPRGRVGV